MRLWLLGVACDWQACEWQACEWQMGSYVAKKCLLPAPTDGYSKAVTCPATLPREQAHIVVRLAQTRVSYVLGFSIYSCQGHETLSFDYYRMVATHILNQ